TCRCCRTSTKRWIAWTPTSTARARCRTMRRSPPCRAWARRWRPRTWRCRAEPDELRASRPLWQAGVLATGESPMKQRHFSMLREFHLADWFTLANAFCGTGAIFAAMRFLQDGGVRDLLIGMALITLA